jgi:hypothetical protein
MIGDAEGIKLIQYLFSQRCIYKRKVKAAVLWRE